MKIVSADQMREIERRAAEVGLPWQILMDNAGLAIAKEVRKLKGSVLGSSIVILVGPGNNGGDGLVAGRHLHDWGARVSLYLSHPRKEEDTNYRSALQRGIAVTEAEKDVSMATLDDLLSSAEVVIDALLGTGKARPMGGILKDILERVGQAKKKRPGLTIVAVDLPSGLDADSGAIDPATPKVDVTVTLGYPKLGAFSFPGAERVGQLIIADIGIPPGVGRDIPTELITPQLVRQMLPARPLDANKGTFGRLMVVAGSNNYIGAAYLACAAAMRVGVGLVTLAVAQSLHPILAAKLTEVTYLPLPELEPGVVHQKASEALQQSLSGYQAILIGCGLGQHPATVEFVQSLLFSSRPESLPTLVLDADALNILSRSPGWWERLPSDAILTPHPGEMSRLAGIPVADIQSSRFEHARQAASQWQKTVVLKGAHTIVATPDGKAVISPFANPGLASAGTGDVLSGAIAGLLAQGLSQLDAAVCGVYLHGQAGEIIREEVGDMGMVASDLLPILPKVIKSLRSA